jgi:hypothetical protein
MEAGPRRLAARKKAQALHRNLERLVIVTPPFPRVQRPDSPHHFVPHRFEMGRRSLEEVIDQRTLEQVHAVGVLAVEVLQPRERARDQKHVAIQAQDVLAAPREK